MHTVQKKVCLLGDFAVGKTSLIRRFVEGRFDDRYLSTIGVKISRKTVTRADHLLNLLIWDLAGGDEEVLMVGRAGLADTEAAAAGEDDDELLVGVVVRGEREALAD